MKSEVTHVLERLRSSRSWSWLRVIDEADLDGQVDEEPAPDAVVAPYRWLVSRIGEAVRLTQAGYLPPTLVREAMGALGWDDDWYGRITREDNTPILHLRESAQRFGLLRKSRGQLLVTKLGCRLVDDPSAMWWHLVGRLPEGRSQAERDAGALYLLRAAAGQPRDDEELAEGLAILGWVQGDNWSTLSPLAASRAALDTSSIFYRLGLLPDRAPGDVHPLPPSEAGVRVARAALLGQAQPSHPASSQASTSDVVSTRRAESAVQLTVTLADIEPPVWRQLVVPTTLTLQQLHGVIQTAMGWQDYHLHMFDINGVLYGNVEDLVGRALGHEETFTLERVAEVTREFSYDYDFGDGWSHHIRIGETLPSVGPSTPQLTGGARACPPEDCGGIGGYQRLLEVLGDPTDPEYGQLTAWVGGYFDAEEFDVAEANALLELFDRHTRQRLTPPR